MIKNSELAEKLGIPHTKIKRWTREFLPPDPLARKQSGYTRTLSDNEAFKVYLGGHLVSALNFSVHEARIILEDLKDWLSAKGLLPDVESLDLHELEKQVSIFYVDIMRGGAEKFWYFVKGSVERQHLAGTINGVELAQEQYVQYTIGGDMKFLSSELRPVHPLDQNRIDQKRLHIQNLLINYLRKVKGEKEALSKVIGRRTWK